MQKKLSAVLAATMCSVIFVSVGCGSTEKTSLLNEATQAKNSGDVEISVEGKVYGSAKVDFNEKENFPFTTIKKYVDTDLTEEGTKVEYSEGVCLTLTGNGEPLDDSKIDLSQAKVSLLEGDGYQVDDIIFSGEDFADRATVENGTITYVLKESDIEWNQYNYPVAEGGVEWSCQGGDGNGHYNFNMKVSGIEYDGTVLEDVSFDAEVYIYGRMFDSQHSPNGASDSVWGVGMFDNEMITGFTGLPDAEKKELEDKPEQVDKPTFIWNYGNPENTKPVFCDYTTDNLYIIWPNGVDASQMTADQVTLTLKSAYGDALVLTENTGTRTLEQNGKEVPNGDYKVYADADVTQISINYVNWAMTPVYNRLEVSIDTSAVDGYDESVAEEYEIASVYAYTYQMGGGLDIEGKTVTAVAINGIKDMEDLETEDVIDISKASYCYSYGEQNQGEQNQDAEALYLIENEDGTYSVTDDKEKATVYQYGTDSNLANVSLNNHTLFVTSVPSVEVEYKGEVLRFSANIAAGMLIKNPSEIGEPDDGYAFSDSMMAWMAHQNWAYLYFNDQGWKE